MPGGDAWTMGGSEEKVDVLKVYCESRFTGSGVGLDEEGVQYLVKGFP